MADFDFITSRVATGAAIDGPADVTQILAAGLNVVVDARSEYDDGSLFTATPGVHYLWNPTADDGKFKPVHYWLRTLSFVMPLLAQPHMKVLLHCTAGVNRGPSNALCVMVAQGFSPALARTMIITARTQAQIRYQADAVAACSALGF